MDNFLTKLYEEEQEKVASADLQEFMNSLSVDELAEFLGIRKTAQEHMSQERREGLSSSQFAVPESKAKKIGVEGEIKGEAKGKYPIPDEKHARNALARVSQFGTPAEREAVRKKVYAKYPDLKEGFEERHGESPTAKENVKKVEQGNIGKEGCPMPKTASVQRLRDTMEKLAKEKDKAIQHTYRSGVTPLSPATGALKGGTTAGLIGAGLGTAAGGAAAARRARDVAEYGEDVLKGYPKFFRKGGPGKGALIGALAAGALGAGGGAALSALKRRQLKSDTRQIRKLNKEAGIPGPDEAPMPSGMKGSEVVDRAKAREERGEEAQEAANQAAAEAKAKEKDSSCGVKHASAAWADQMGRFMAHDMAKEAGFLSAVASRAGKSMGTKGLSSAGVKAMKGMPSATKMVAGKGLAQRAAQSAMKRSPFQSAAARLGQKARTIARPTAQRASNLLRRI